MNTELLRQIQKEITQHPSQVVMQPWFNTVSSMERPPERCGTAGCIGGWALSLGKKITLKEASLEVRSHSKPIHDQAKKLLKLNEPKAERLFFVEAWPHRFRNRLNKAVTDEVFAKVVSDRIGHFIKTKGIE